MSKASKEKIGVQFYRLTKEEIKQWYRDKLLTTAGYLLAIKKVTKMPGSNMVIPNVLQFCREWEISKSAFYRAVNELRQKGYTDWEATHGIILKETKKVVSFPLDESCPASETECPALETECPTDGTECPTVGTEFPTSETVSHERDGVSHERDGVSHERDGVSHERDSVSHKRENRSSKTAQHKNFSVPTDRSDRSRYIQTLSDREREDFLNFGKKKAASLPNPPELPLRWIEANWDELLQQWNLSRGKAPSSSKWENDPRTPLWLAELEELRHTLAFFAPGDKLDREKQAFTIWAEENNLLSWKRKNNGITKT